MTIRKKTWLWWSTGKDSAWALHRLRSDPSVEVVGLVTTVTETFDRVSVHGVRTAILEAQGKAANLPVHRVEIPYPCTNDEYEAAAKVAVDSAVAGGVSAMAFGDLFLEDVRSYREDLLAGTGVEALFPLWGADTTQLINDLLGGGVQAYVSCLDPDRVPRNLAGRLVDRAFLEALPSSVDPCGENGEFHTCVAAGPMFDAPVPICVGETIERDGVVFTDLTVRPPGPNR